MLFWYERCSAAIITGISIAFVFVSFYYIATVNPVVLQSRKIVLIGFEKEGNVETWDFSCDTSFPLSSLLLQIPYSREIDFAEIPFSKKIGSFVGGYYVLPKKHSCSFVIIDCRNIHEMPSYYRFDFLSKTSINELYVQLEARFCANLAKKIIGKKKKVLHIQYVVLS